MGQCNVRNTFFIFTRCASPGLSELLNASLDETKIAYSKEKEIKSQAQGK